MFFMKIFQFFKGYVILSLTGYAIERFINICARRGIVLISIEKHDKDSAKVAMYLEDFRAIRPVAFKTKTKIKILRKCGFPILVSRYKHRYVMIAGCFVCAVLLAVSSQFIWFIEYEGVENTDIHILQEAVEKAGVRAGAAKADLPSGNEMKSVILNSTDGISWAWVYVRGTKAVVQVKESVRAPAVVDKDTPCDIVALCDGVIKNVTAKVGRSAVKRGDAVLAGDVVIAGTLDSEVVGYRLCHALGSVEAYTYHKKTGEYKLYNEIRSYTGNQKTRVTLNLFSKKIPLFKDTGISYEDYDTIEDEKQLHIGSNYYLGLGFSTCTYKEVEVIQEPISYETAVEIAKADLEEQIAGELIAGADLQKQTVKEEKIDDETVRVTVYMDFIEKIGSEQPIIVQQQE